VQASFRLQPTGAPNDNVVGLTDHLSKMESLLKARQEIAEMLEFPSYSHMTSWHRILKSPDQVLSFLDVRYFHIIIFKKH
jgi:Zn-dependent oligopeptidase